MFVKGVEEFNWMLLSLRRLIIWRNSMHSARPAIAGHFLLTGYCEQQRLKLKRLKKWATIFLKIIKIK